MASKYCSACIKKLPLSLFLKDASNSGSKVLATCNTCWARMAKSRMAKSKRKALQLLDPNIQSKRHIPPIRLNSSIPLLNHVELRLAATIPPLNSPESRLKPLIPPPTLLESRPETTIPPNPPESHLETTIPPNPPKSRLETNIPIPTPPLIQP